MQSVYIVVVSAGHRDEARLPRKEDSFTGI